MVLCRRLHCEFRGAGEVDWNPGLSPLHPTVSWPLSLETKGGVGLLIKVELSTSGLSLASVTALGHPLAGLLRDIFHYHRYDTLDGPITALGRCGGAQGCGKARQEVLSGERDAGGGREVPCVQFQEARTQRGGRSWKEMHRLPFLRAPGLMLGTGHREEAGDCPAC